MYLEDQNRKVYTFAQIYVDSTLNIEYSINSSINKDRVLGWNINSFTLQYQHNVQEAVFICIVSKNIMNNSLHVYYNAQSNQYL